MPHWESIYFNSASALSHIKELVLVELECGSYQIECLFTQCFVSFAHHRVLMMMTIERRSRHVTLPW